MPGHLYEQIPAASVQHATAWTSASGTLRAAWSAKSGNTTAHGVQKQRKSKIPPRADSDGTVVPKCSARADHLGDLPPEDRMIARDLERSCCNMHAKRLDDAVNLPGFRGRWVVSRREKHRAKYQPVFSHEHHVELQLPPEARTRLNTPKAQAEKRETTTAILDAHERDKSPAGCPKLFAQDHARGLTERAATPLDRPECYRSPGSAGGGGHSHKACSLATKTAVPRGPLSLSATRPRNRGRPFGRLLNTRFSKGGPARTP